jgi:L-threonylcarbamoyladenylate synthase
VPTHLPPSETSHWPETGPATEAAIADAVAILKRGGLVAFPTETVYGLGADAENPDALKCLYAVKGRPGHHPVIVHLASADQLQDWAREIPDAAWQLAKAFWPGPLTLILPRSSRVPDAVTGGQGTVGLRVPAHPLAQKLLQAFKGGIAAPSANRFGKLSPTTAAHVRADLGADADLILDGGNCPVGVESTIVAFRDGQPVILRPGMITEAQITAILGQSTANSANGESSAIRAPGTLASHYAPGTPLVVLPPEDLIPAIQQKLAEYPAPIGVLARRERPALLSIAPNVAWVAADISPEGYARALYASLRALDAQGLSTIIVEEPPDTEEWAAVRDRLQRAAYRA